MSLANLEGIYKKLWVAPYSLKSNVIRMIDREIEKAKMGKEARIIMKMNSLTDRDIIDKFAEASQAGVTIRLIIRGICCLIPGIPGKTDKITVTSNVGRFLEHSRIYCFGTGADMSLYIASADMMTRNTQRRVEIACPVLDNRLKDRICDMLDVMLDDTVKGRVLYSSGTYRFPPREPFAIASQEYFMRQAIERARTNPAGSKPSVLSKFKHLFKK